MSNIERLPAPRSAGRASLAIDNLRAIVVVGVLAFHAMLAYLAFLPHHPFSFAREPMLWRAFPIVDNSRFLGFDLFCAWLDVFLMSFFFLLSGLFAWPSLMRKGARAFAVDRVIRLGVPFAVVVFVLMPVAEYPAYAQATTDAGLADYWRQFLALPLWPSGPVWFLWMLLVGDLLVAGLFALLAGDQDRRRQLVPFLSEYARRRPAHFLAGLVIASGVAYVPLALIFGTQEWFQLGPFAVQLCRPLQYAVYFFAGVAIGACGIERGLLAADGPLVRQWRRWLLATPPLFLTWCGLTGLAMRQGAAAPLILRSAADLAYVLACFASSFAVLAVAVRFVRQQRSPLCDAIKGNAYGMYLVHYPFIVWLQYALLGFAWLAVAKAALVFSGTVIASWSLAGTLRRVPVVARVIGASTGRGPVGTPPRAAVALAPVRTAATAAANLRRAHPSP